MHAPLPRRVRRLTAVCLLVWALATLAPVLAARSPWRLAGWPVDFWLAAQGSVLVYLAVVVVYASLVNRWEAQASGLDPATQAPGPDAPPGQRG